ncbi:putative RNA recognition motif containing protein [Lyophyllum shimeji]|uniref:RNA recognition motif containing protein n=1 Tax=Lyophyllum shimeji TaxID=47721 RepID=A0A9P3PV96_LYOSH|nr:putative RNA recognition motif containing protein [Lyophyllum shimeji]
MSVTLGKRKDRDEAPDGTPHHGSTLFVSNLPYTATSVDLQTLFSDIAPVRSAFVVTEPGTGVSKGVGYVSFAIKEDAQTAYDTISKDGLSLVGRNLRVQWAESKHKDKGEKGEKVKKESKPRPAPRPQPPKLPHDPLSIRTIVISGLPSSIDSKVLWKKIRKCNGAEKVDWPVKSAAGDDDSSTAHVLFNTPGAASEAVTKLHAHVFKGCLLSVTLKKRLDTLYKPVPTTKLTTTTTTTTATAAPSHASRLIVRNLPFTATEQDLRAAFLPYGPIHSIHIPKVEDGTEEGEGEGEGEKQKKNKRAARSKGFAFVWMVSKKDAEKAIGGCNGMVIRAGAAEALVADKQKRKKQRREERRIKAAGKDEDEGEGEGEDEGEDEDEKDVDDKKATERVIAVDWALSKEKWKEEKAKMETEEGGDVEMDDASSSEGSGEDSDEGSSDEEGDLGVHTADGDDDDDGSEDEDEGDGDMEEPVKPSLPPPDIGTTLFIRNVPFDATEDELRTLFRGFGPLRYARITIDQATGRSRGTGFACFWSKEDADKAVAQSDLIRAETTGVTAPVKKNPFTMPSILTPDPSSTLAQSLVLHGRTLDVVRAVTRDEAGKLQEAGEKARNKADKRNMYLLREGVILPNTPAAETLTPAEVERRTASFNARRALLKSNPSLYISKTRLSVRQIPIFVTERLMKRLAIHAVRAFEADVKKGEREALTADELADRSEPQDEEEGAEKKGNEKKQRQKGRATAVKQAKIVRQQERVDSVTGKGRSKGYGFVEMHTHADALRVLRWANNNPAVEPLFEEWWKDELRDLIKVETAKEQKDEARLAKLKEELERERGRKGKGTLIVEFSIENIQVVQRRNAKQQKTPSENKKPKEETKTSEERPSKKRRMPEDKPKIVKETEAKKPKNDIGSIIGRKRKERKAGKKGSR